MANTKMRPLIDFSSWDDKVIWERSRLLSKEIAWSMTKFFVFIFYFRPKFHRGKWTTIRENCSTPLQGSYVLPCQRTNPLTLTLTLTQTSSIALFPAFMSGMPTNLLIVVFWLAGLSGGLTNAFILYKNTVKNPVSHHDFLCSISQYLLQ